MKFICLFLQQVKKIVKNFSCVGKTQTLKYPNLSSWGFFFLSSLFLIFTQGSCHQLEHQAVLIGQHHCHRYSNQRHQHQEPLAALSSGGRLLALTELFSTVLQLTQAGEVLVTEVV